MKSFIHYLLLRPREFTAGRSIMSISTNTTTSASKLSAFCGCICRICINSNEKLLNINYAKKRLLIPKKKALKMVREAIVVTVRDRFISIVCELISPSQWFWIKLKINFGLGCLNLLTNRPFINYVTLKRPFFEPLPKAYVTLNHFTKM